MTEIIESFITGIGYGFAFAVLIGFVTWGFWLVFRFFKQVSSD